MRVSFNLLKEMVELDSTITAEEVANKLTFAGVEVEECYPLAQASGLVVGQIVSCEPHPDSDHLHLLKVDLGEKRGVLDIVCGAPNARKGLKTIVATVGANLKAIGVTIKKSTILGHESNGMCCSLAELGVSDELLSEKEKNGIYEIEEDAKVGDEEVLKLLGLDDYILDLNVLANRPDLLSMRGVAREVAALFSTKVKDIPELEYKKTQSIEVSSKTEKCSCFCLLKVRTDGKAKTPVKMKQYLRALGYRSINLAVDIGNFMMVITGQPFHFYDSEKAKAISGTEKYVVRDDFEGQIITLDEKVIDVKLGDLVVTNGETPMCLGGVMGLKNVATDENSHEFGIESAYFDYAQIRHTVNRTGLASDSSSRFIKKVNKNLTAESLRILAHVYKSIDPSFEVISYSAFNDEPEKLRTISYSVEKTNARLGSHFSQEEVYDVFKRLRIKVNKDGTVVPPIDRQDLIEQADLDEEVFRYNDPSKLDLSLNNFPVTPGKMSEKYAKCHKISNYLSSIGLYEILSYTLIDEKLNSSYRLFNEGVESIKIANPMTNDHEYIRSDLTSSIVKTIEYNLSRQKDDFGIFEIADLRVGEKDNTYLAIGLTGLKKTRSLLEKVPYDFYDLKGYVESVLALLNISPNRYTVTRSNNKYLHPGRSAEIYVGKDCLGVFGEITPQYQKKPILIAELDLTKMMEIKSGSTKFAPFSIYPDVERDFCFVLSSDVTSASLLSTVKKAVGSTLKSLDIFDVYDLGNEKKSIAFRVKLTNMDHTFKDEEIKAISDKIISAVQSKLNGELR